jgi:hypothetical protein
MMETGELEVRSSPASRITCFEFFIFHGVRAKG